MNIISPQFLLLFICFLFQINQIEAQEIKTLKNNQLFKEEGLWYHEKTKEPLNGTYRVKNKHIYSTYFIEDVEQISFVKGLAEGAYKAFVKSKKKLELGTEGELKAGLKNGEWFTYNLGSNNNIKQVDNYVDGIRDGQSIKYRNNKENEIASICTYKDGFLDGQSIEYHNYSENRISSTCIYEDGVLNGEILYYKYNGDLDTISCIKNRLVRDQKENGIDSIFYNKYEIVKAVHYDNTGKLVRYLFRRGNEATIFFYDNENEIGSSLSFSTNNLDSFLPGFRILWDNCQKIPLTDADTKIYDRDFTSSSILNGDSFDGVIFKRTIYKFGKPYKKQAFRLKPIQINGDDYWDEYIKLEIDKFAKLDL